MSDSESPSNTVDSAVIAQQMRVGMRHLAAGVCVVSAGDSSGQRAAMTATSVTSVSDQPPSLLVCVNRQARISQLMHAGELFAINVLSAAQQEVSVLCSTPEEGEKRFSRGAWQRYASGLFYLDDALSVFVCRTRQCITHGTHDIFVGDIEWVKAADITDDANRALVYLDGNYHSLP